MLGTHEEIRVPEREIAVFADHKELVSDVADWGGWSRFSNGLSV